VYLTQTHISPPMVVTQLPKLNKDLLAGPCVSDYGKEFRGLLLGASAGVAHS
jgi:hypothetical protein